MKTEAVKQNDEGIDVITVPVSEKEILAVTEKKTAAKAIVEDINARGLSCVDHLCGCK